MNAPPAPDLAAVLRAIVRDVVAEVVREELDAVRADLAQPYEPPPALLDRGALARELGCSVAQVSRLKAEGLPFVPVGDSPRYQLAECIAWLRDRTPA